jgi:Domain of unknown function (DUF4303)
VAPYPRPLRQPGEHTVVYLPEPAFGSSLSGSLCEPDGMMTKIVEEVFGRVSRALHSLTETERGDVYAVSLFVYDHEDEPSTPTVEVSVNTEAHVALRTPDASDADEARWNFAFWPQQPIDVIGGPNDPAGKQIIDASFSNAGLTYDPDDYSDEALEVGRRMTEAFVAACVAAVQRLHSEGAVEAVFGLPIPVFVHELEYYDEIAEQNRLANPAELVEPFSRWIHEM